MLIKLSSIVASELPKNKTGTSQMKFSYIYNTCNVIKIKNRPIIAY